MGIFYSIYASLLGGSDDNTPDPDTGLTGKEREAITSSWALLSPKKEIRKNGVEFFVMLFEEYPYMQLSFQAFKGMSSDELRKDRAMHSHSVTVMYSIGSLVENLDDAEQLVLLVNKIAHNHVAKDVGLKYFEDLAEMWPRFLESRVGSAATPFIKESWGKFLGVMNSLVEVEEKKQQKS